MGHHKACYYRIRSQPEISDVKHGVLVSHKKVCTWRNFITSNIFKSGTGHYGVGHYGGTVLIFYQCLHFELIVTLLTKHTYDL